jgi:hypothetical protein
MNGLTFCNRIISEDKIYHETIHRSVQVVEVLSFL